MILAYQDKWSILEEQDMHMRVLHIEVYIYMDNSPNIIYIYIFHVFYFSCTVHTILFLPASSVFLHVPSIYI